VNRPTAAELIDAVRMHLETNIVPVVRADRKLYFQTLVAMNVLRIVERELELGPRHIRAALQRLNDVLGTDAPFPDTLDAARDLLAQRDAELSQAIRAGDYDHHPRRADLFNHLKASAVEQLLIANPRLLATLQQEEADPSLDAWEGRNDH
jgi:hypothetical protein